MDAFDADVLIYAAAPEHPLGGAVRELFRRADLFAGVGSLLLVPEVLTRPAARGDAAEAEALAALFGRLELFPVDEEIAALAVSLGATHGLRAADAVHLATAVAAGAERFITNNRRDFPPDIEEVAVTYPSDLETREPPSPP